MPYQEASAKLQELMRRQDRVLSVMHPPSAALARVMEAAGAEAGFVGTSGVVGSYTGLEDVGTATLSECILIAGWIARAVSFPVILDGDTGHGGVMAVRRMVEDCIKEGLAGVRIDDQPIEGKRGTGTAGMEVESLEVVLARYRAAVERKRELDPNFVVIAQCYAGEAANGGFSEALERMKAYKEVGEVDWVQFTAPHVVEEVTQARETVKGPFSIMQGFMNQPLSNDELLTLGINIAWVPGPTHLVTYVALYDYVQDFMARGPVAFEDFKKAHSDNPYVTGELRIGGAQVAKQRELEERYFSSEALEKYQGSVGRRPV
ncbi:MAG: isocitrate lyase/PEP mutase family protein [Chloroflexi bacterium]|nr:isocitrate lyase/PEP mutase family protein [Chloroflexota bacterium]